MWLRYNDIYILRDRKIHIRGKLCFILYASTRLQQSPYYKTSNLEIRTQKVWFRSVFLLSKRPEPILIWIADLKAFLFSI